MQYVDPADAQALDGLRLALTAHFPAPYSMSAKAIFDIKHVPYTPVLQRGAAANEDLVAWTKHRNAPVAVYENEAPRSGWLEILYLAERLGRGPSLLPESSAERMHMIGLTHELIGEGGLIWNMRLLMLGLGGAEAASNAAVKNPMYADYGYSEEHRAKAGLRCREIIELITEHARAQSGHYLIAGQFSALDIYWVFFSQLLQTFPHEIAAMPEGLREFYDQGSALVGGCEPFLIEQRDWILANHLSSPLEF